MVGSTTVSQLLQLNNHLVLHVNNEPFVILGMQWDCDGCYSPEEMDPLFEQAEKMYVNTAALPLYWREIEPDEGRYDFSMLDHRIEMARKHNLKIVLIWFASFKNACMTYAPDYIRRDHKKFRKVHRKDGSLVTNCCCPTSNETKLCDKRALIEVFNHLKNFDAEQNTVILFQMENEVGILDSDRCYCKTCTERYENEKWAEEYGWRGPEAFTAGCIAEYCDSLTKTIKTIHPIPVYINAALALEYINSIPGRCWLDRRGGHFCGGPIGRVLDVYQKSIKHIDFIAPDIYQYGYRDFRKFCKEYSWKGNPLYIAECATGKDTRTDKNVIYALGDFSAIGFDPWAISRSCPQFMSQPLVNLSDLVWSQEAYDLRNSYKIIKDIMNPLVLAQNTDRLRIFVQEEGDEGIKIQFEDTWVEIKYDHPQNAARGFVIKFSGNEFLISGTGVFVQFSKISGDLIPIRTVEKGSYAGHEWICRHVAASEQEDESMPVQLRDCIAVKIKLGPRIDHENHI